MYNYIGVAYWKTTAFKKKKSKKKSASLHINPVKQYTNFKVGEHVSLVVKISLHTPLCGCCGKCSIKKERKKMDFGAFNILILFCLKNVHCLPMNDS